MIRKLACFATPVVVLSFLFACSSSGSDTPHGTDGGAGEGGAGEEGGNGEGGGGEGGGPVDGGPKPYGTVPPGPIVNYTCVKELHVATTGDDANDGSAASPFRTIAKAAPLAKAGECIKVHAGTYNEGTTIAFGVDGTLDAPVVLVSVDGKGKAIIDGATNRTGPAVQVQHDHVVVDGFEFLNTPLDANVHVVRFDGMYAGKCVGSVLRNSKITGGHNHLKIYQATQGVLVEYNEFYGKAANAPISLTGASGLIFRSNFGHDWDSGENGALQLAGGSKDALFEKNLFQDVASFAGTMALGDNCGNTCDNDPDHYAAVNARAVDNVFIRVTRPFDVLGCKSCALLSNTIINSGQKNLIFKLGSATTNGNSRDTVGTRIINNIVTNFEGTMEYVIQVNGGSAGGIQMDYNLFWNATNGVLIGETRPAGNDTHSVTMDPKLVGPMDFRPAAGSPAIGAGTNLVSEVPQDFLGVARPAADPFDIGAYQH